MAGPINDTAQALARCCSPFFVLPCRCLPLGAASAPCPAPHALLSVPPTSMLRNSVLGAAAEEASGAAYRVLAAALPPGSLPAVEAFAGEAACAQYACLPAWPGALLASCIPMRRPASLERRLCRLASLLLTPRPAARFEAGFVVGFTRGVLDALFGLAATDAGTSPAGRRLRAAAGQAPDAEAAPPAELAALVAGAALEEGVLAGSGTLPAAGDVVRSVGATLAAAQSTPAPAPRGSEGRSLLQGGPCGRGSLDAWPGGASGD